MVLNKIGVLSCGKMSGALYAVFGLIAGFFVAVGSMLGAAFGEGGIGGAMLGVGAIVLLPIVYGIIGFIGGIIVAFFYNILAGFVGGIELDLE